MSVWQQSVLCVTSSVILRHLGVFGWLNIFLWKSLQNDVFILLDQRIINLCYLLRIFRQYRFLCDLAFKEIVLILIFCCEDEDRSTVSRRNYVDFVRPCFRLAFIAVTMTSEYIISEVPYKFAQSCAGIVTALGLDNCATFWQYRNWLIDKLIDRFIDCSLIWCTPGLTPTQ